MIRPKGNIPIFLIIIILAAGAAVYFLVKSNTVTPQNSYPTPSPSPTNVALKTFQSETMNFSIEIPQSFQTEEKFGSVTIKNGSGIILIMQNATNFDNLKEYIKNSKNNLENRIAGREDLVINNQEATSGFLENNEKIYLIYADNTVYIISTKSQPIYSDLDQITQSFRYIP